MIADIFNVNVGALLLLVLAGILGGSGYSFWKSPTYYKKVTHLIAILLFAGAAFLIGLTGFKIFHNTQPILNNVVLTKTVHITEVDNKVDLKLFKIASPHSTLTIKEREYKDLFHRNHVEVAGKYRLSYYKGSNIIVKVTGPLNK